MSDQATFGALIEPYRRELHLHCYRITGSLADADDLVQETLLAAWQGLAGFENRSSVRTWLYRIATNRSLNAVRDASRRPQPAGPAVIEPTRFGEVIWLEPYPDSLLDTPERHYESHETISLAYTTMLQHLPGRQRAAIVLCDVLDFRLSEAASILETTTVAVKSMLQRARVTLAAQRDQAPPAPSARERELASLFAVALQAGDTPAMVSLLTDDAWFTMPPLPHEYQGPALIGAFLDYRAADRGSPLRCVMTRANGQPAFATYLPGPNGVAEPWGIMVITVTDAGITAITSFHKPSLLGYFDVPKFLEPS